MKNEKLILKWLNGDMSPEELDAFKKTEDYKSYSKIASYAQGLKPEQLNTEQTYQELQQRLENTSKMPKVIKPNFGWVRYAAAAVVAVLLSTYFLFNSNEIQTQTKFGEIAQTQLPDESQVFLNAKSSITVNKKSWDNANRLVNLNGEAFFKVTKGQKFTVETPAGSVQVLGTQFNVKERDSYFEVQCYEGRVQVIKDSDTLILTPGMRYRNIDGIAEQTTSLTSTEPSWLDKESEFDTVPIGLVFDEMQRQFNIKIEAAQVDQKIVFKGGFSNTDLELALKSVCNPLNLDYTIDGNTVKIVPNAS